MRVDAIHSRLSVWKKYDILGWLWVFCIAYGIIGDCEENPITISDDDGFLFPDDQQQHRANLVEDAATANNQQQDFLDGDENAFCEDMAFAQGKVLQLRYVYSLSTEMKTQHLIREILQGT